eukprot:scaffold18278_cov100-Isochrysis_galbana.AAC.3
MGWELGAAGWLWGRSRALCAGYAARPERWMRAWSRDASEIGCLDRHLQRGGAPPFGDVQRGPGSQQGHNQ